MVPPRSAFGAPPQGGAPSGPAKPAPRRPLDGLCLRAERRAAPKPARIPSGDRATYPSNEGLS
jgi:hypothetical protein